jgi:hypothetical protein
VRTVIYQRRCTAIVPSPLASAFRRSGLQQEPANAVVKSNWCVVMSDPVPNVRAENAHPYAWTHGSRCSGGIRTCNSSREGGRILPLMTNVGREKEPEPMLAKISQTMLTEMVGHSECSVLSSALVQHVRLCGD